MKEHPILFSAPMVRAILAGTKTQTRRIVKWQGPKGFPHYFDRAFLDNPAGILRLNVPYHHPKDSDTGDDNPAIRHYPPQGEPGDQLWVKETFRHYANSYCAGKAEASVLYSADDVNRHVELHSPPVRKDWTKKQPSIFMPRWASRITLEIAAVRVERLQEISGIDAQEEGAEGILFSGGGVVQPPNYRAGYYRLWESINGPGSWGQNPWVWVVGFKCINA